MTHTMEDIVREMEKMRKEIAELKSTSKFRPEAYKLDQRTEWVRLAREAHGYIHTCINEHGTDYAGRKHAIEGLKAMAEALKVPA